VRSPALAPRGPACPSDLGLLQLVSGELRGAAPEPDLRAHVATCDRCRVQVSRFAAADLPPLPDLGAVAAPARDRSPTASGTGRPRTWSRRPRRQTVVAGGVAAMAAALIFVLVVGRGGDALPVGALRSKGSLALGIVARHGSGAEERLGGGAAAAPGDVIRFELVSDTPGFPVVLGLDSRRVVSLYYPQTGGGPARLPAGRSLLPVAVSLDDAPGSERIFALVCPEPPVPEDLRAEVARRFVASGLTPDQTTSLATSCTEASLLLRKTTPP
jgi:hypothetical protein